MKNGKIILLVIGLILLVVGTTYAVYTWAIKGVNINGISECFKVDYDKGQDIGSVNNSRTLLVSDDYTGGLFASVIVNLNKNCTITNGIGTLYLEVDNNTSSGLLTSGALKYQVVENGFPTTDKGVGTITSTGKIPIYENISIGTNPIQLSVAVWIDSSMITSSNSSEIFSSTFSGKISMRVESGDK